MFFCNSHITTTHDRVIQPCGKFSQGLRRKRGDAAGRASQMACRDCDTVGDRGRKSLTREVGKLAGHERLARARWPIKADVSERSLVLPCVFRRDRQPPAPSTSDRVSLGDKRVSQERTIAFSYHLTQHKCSYRTRDSIAGSRTTSSSAFPISIPFAR
jgi:hypothetical protein